MSQPKIVLASKSPTRKSALEKLGVSFKIAVSHLDEEAIRDKYSDPKELVLKLAEAKTE